MSVGNLLWGIDPSNPQGIFGSSQRDAHDQREARKKRLEQLRIERENREQEYSYLLKELGLTQKQATGVSNIASDSKDRDAWRQAGTNRTNAEIYTGTVLPATTQSQIQIASNDSKNKVDLIKTAAGETGRLQEKGIQLRTGAMDKFLPLVTDQITKIQAAPVDLARLAIGSQEMEAEKDRAFVKELWHLQNPKLGFVQRFANAAPGLAAAALLAFS